MASCDVKSTHWQAVPRAVPDAATMTPSPPMGCTTTACGVERERVRAS